MSPDNISHREDDDDARRWQEAAELRQVHRAWIVIWLAPHREFRAYRRLAGRRRDTTLHAATASDMRTQIAEAEKLRAARPVTGDPPGPDEGS